MDPFWGVSPWRWPGPSQPIRGWRLNQLWSVPEAPRLWEHQDRAYHRHVLSIKVTDGFTVQWVTGWLGGGVVIGWDTNQKLCQQLLSEQSRWLSCTLLCWSVFVIHHRCYTLDFKAVLFVLPALTWWLLSVTMTMTSLSPSSLRTDTTVS